MKREPGWGRTSNSFTTCGWPPGGSGPPWPSSPACCPATPAGCGPSWAGWPTNSARSATWTSSWGDWTVGGDELLGEDAAALDRPGPAPRSRAGRGPRKPAQVSRFTSLRPASSPSSPRWSDRVAWQGPGRQMKAAQAPAAAVVPGLILARHRSALIAARRAARSGDPDDFHRLRIRCKRLRYALEFVSEIYEGRTRGVIRRVVGLQDCLGLMQDAQVAAARLRSLATASNSGLSTGHRLRHGHDGRALPARLRSTGHNAARPSRGAEGTGVEEAEEVDGSSTTRDRTTRHLVSRSVDTHRAPG